MNISLEKLKHLNTKMLTVAECDAITGANVKDYASKLNTALKGKHVRIKLSGKEQRNASTGKTFTERYFNFYPWAEAIDAPQRTLKFNQASLSDFKPMATVANTAAVGAPVDEDLPF